MDGGGAAAPPPAGSGSAGVGGPNSHWVNAVQEIGQMQRQVGTRWFYSLQWGLIGYLVLDLYNHILPCELRKLDHDHGVSSLGLSLALFICYSATLFSTWPIGLLLFKTLGNWVGTTEYGAQLRFLAWWPLQWFYEVIAGLALGSTVGWFWSHIQYSMRCLRTKDCPVEWIKATEQLVDQVLSPLGLYNWGINAAWFAAAISSMVLSERIINHFWPRIGDSSHRTSALFRHPAPPAMPVPTAAAGPALSEDLICLNELAAAVERFATLNGNALDCLGLAGPGGN